MYTHFIHSTLRLFLVIILAVCSFASFYFIANLIYPFIISLLLAIIINPVVAFLEKTCRLPRSISVLLSLLLFVSIIVGVISILVAELVTSSTYFADVIPLNLHVVASYLETALYDLLLPLYDKFSTLYENLDPGTKGTIIENIKVFGSSLTTFATDFFKSLLAGLTNLITSLPSFITVFMFSSIATFFLSKDWEKLNALAVKVIPGIIIKNSKDIASDLSKALGGYIRAQLTLISITFCIVLIGLLILRIQYAFSFAVAIALVDILPYLGTSIIFIPWIVYSFIVGNSNFAIALLILYLVIVIQRQVMEPKILSSSIGLHPLALLIVLFVGFKLMGFIGLMVGPALLVFVKTLYKTGIFSIIKQFILGKEPR